MVGQIQPIYNSYAASAVSAYNPYASANALYNYNNLIAIQAEDELFALGLSSGSGSGSSTANANLESALPYADLLNLSPAALNVLNGVEAADTATPGDLAVTTNLAVTTSSNSGSASKTALTPAQQQQAAAIIAQYAYAPFTQQTFTQIENALMVAGINPQQVSIQQLLEGYNYAYSPAYAVTNQLADETLASDLEDA